MATNAHAELTIPSDGSLQGLADACVRQLATAAGFGGNEVDAWQYATAAACSSIARHAYTPAQPGQLTVAVDLTPAALAVAIRVRGLPFDPNAAEPAAGLPDTPGRALPSLEELMGHHVVDDARWLNNGPRGLELRLAKDRPVAHVTDMMPAEALTPFHEDAPVAPEQEYTIRRLRPEDGIQVCQVVYRTYGYTYSNQDLYYPDRVVHLNETGELVSVVAVDAAGEIVGYYALERDEPGPVAESAQAMVNPAHRGRRLMERMRTLLEDEARQLGLVGIFGQPVTNHLASQHAQDSFGSHVCGISLGLAPDDIHFARIGDDSLSQRLSLMLYFLALQPPAARVAYAPAEHHAMLARIYAQLATPVDLQTGRAPTGRGQVRVDYSRSYRLGTIRVEQVGADTAAEVRRAHRDLCDTVGAQAVYLELPLAQPGTPSACHAAEADGFSFGGIGPDFAPDGDVLRLAYLAVDLDPAKLQISSPFGRELLAYVVGQRARVGQPPPRPPSPEPRG